MPQIGQGNEFSNICSPTSHFRAFLHFMEHGIVAINNNNKAWWYEIRDNRGSALGSSSSGGGAKALALPEVSDLTVRCLKLLPSGYWLTTLEAAQFVHELVEKAYAAVSCYAFCRYRNTQRSCRCTRMSIIARLGHGNSGRTKALWGAKADEKRSGKAQARALSWLYHRRAVHCVAVGSRVGCRWWADRAWYPAWELADA